MQNPHIEKYKAGQDPRTKLLLIGTTLVYLRFLTQRKPLPPKLQVSLIYGSFSRIPDVLFRSTVLVSVSGKREWHKEIKDLLQ